MTLILWYSINHLSKNMESIVFSLQFIECLISLKAAYVAYNHLYILYGVIYIILWLPYILKKTNKMGVMGSRYAAMFDNDKPHEIIFVYTLMTAILNSILFCSVGTDVNNGNLMMALYFLMMVKNYLSRFLVQPTPKRDELWLIIKNFPAKLDVLDVFISIYISYSLQNDVFGKKSIAIGILYMINAPSYHFYTTIMRADGAAVVMLFSWIFNAVCVVINISVLTPTTPWALLNIVALLVYIKEVKCGTTLFVCLYNRIVYGKYIPKYGSINFGSMFSNTKATSQK